MSVSYVAALDRVIELELLVNKPPWTLLASVHSNVRINILFLKSAFENHLHITSLLVLIFFSFSSNTPIKRRKATLHGLKALLVPSGDYFMKYMDPNGTMHGA